MFPVLKFFYDLKLVLLLKLFDFHLSGYVHIGVCRISPDHNFLAYTLDITGSEKFTLQIKDLRDGHLVNNVKADGVVSLAWVQDGSALVYTVVDDIQRPYR